jgi:carbamoyl-phosphate synthase large subunit
MRSTGEALGLGATFLEAIYKGFIGSKLGIPPLESIILVTICDKDKEEFLPYAERLFKLGARFIGTSDTTKFLRGFGLETQAARKISEAEPNILSIIKSGIIDLIIDIPQRGNNSGSDGFKIRRAAAESSVPLITSIGTVGYLVSVLEENFAEKNLGVISVQDL